VSGPAPKTTRRRRAVPVRGDWRAVPATGWQHGDVPKPPAKLLGRSRQVWVVWFGAWYAAHWQPEDVPGLEIVIRLYDAVLRGDRARASELRLAMDGWGITPKGQQDRRWALPTTGEVEPQPEADRGTGTVGLDDNRYAHLKVV